MSQENVKITSAFWPYYMNGKRLEVSLKRKRPRGKSDTRVYKQYLSLIDIGNVSPSVKLVKT